MDLETITTLPDRTLTIHRNKTVTTAFPKQVSQEVPHPFR